MAKTVNAAFREFNRDFVNLDPDKTKTARKSSDWLYTQLNNFPANDAKFPLKYEGKHIKYGSFSRNTKTRELDDIDLIFCLGGNKATYSQSTIVPDEYYVNTQNAGERLQNLSDDGKLNSIKVVNKLVSSLSNVSQYKSADIHRRQEAATLNLTSYDWTFDIVPAFYTTSGFYLIPNGSGNWKAANPGLDHNYIKSLNERYDSSVHQLVRTLKYWNNRAKMPTISSYLFENFVLNYVESKAELSPYLDINIIDFWSYLKSTVFSNVNDPKGICSNLNELSLDDKLKISEKSNDSYDKGYEAYRLEIKDENQEAAINKWQEIFGSNYPAFN